MSSEFPASGTARAGRGEQGTMLGDRERLVAVGGERVAPRVYLLAERENGRCAVRRTFRGGGKIWILCGRARTRHDERRVRTCVVMRTDTEIEIVRRVGQR